MKRRTTVWQKYAFSSRCSRQLLLPSDSCVECAVEVMLIKACDGRRFGMAEASVVQWSERDKGSCFCFRSIE